ncbi:hypothetical protein PGT21_029640 [Puccinia graminis f. sp. tritici]|uniref:Extradiol ring-cleavage dioxygenase class III enzyme subunit B domain-containing protein n=1 Tax=Puccinia graminis f. sp. tritici TaxID=56615 RepID=A0A5B0P1D4_PUCGR|nr:hypothetical protein PGT21_029640 [Puccinia graminis f. sp. tritici]
MKAVHQHQLSDPSQWNASLAELPARQSEDGVIPAFFFAHGYPSVVFQSESAARRGLQSVGGPLHNFLKDFGPALMEKYRPKGIVVFSAHWESPSKEIKVTDYGDDQPLLYDYYGFPPEFYKARWHSNGSSELTQRVLACLKEAGMEASRTTRDEPRGRDGLVGPAPGLDHGVFIPFMLMFPEGNEKAFPDTCRSSLHGRLPGPGAKHPIRPSGRCSAPSRNLDPFGWRDHPHFRRFP